MLLRLRSSGSAPSSVIALALTPATTAAHQRVHSEPQGSLSLSFAGAFHYSAASLPSSVGRARTCAQHCEWLHRAFREREKGKLKYKIKSFNRLRAKSQASMTLSPIASMTGTSSSNKPSTVAQHSIASSKSSGGQDSSSTSSQSSGRIWRQPTPASKMSTAYAPRSLLSSPMFAVDIDMRAKKSNKGSSSGSQLRDISQWSAAAKASAHPPVSQMEINMATAKLDLLSDSRSSCRAASKQHQHDKPARSRSLTIPYDRQGRASTPTSYGPALTLPIALTRRRLRNHSHNDGDEDDGSLVMMGSANSSAFKGNSRYDDRSPVPRHNP